MSTPARLALFAVATAAAFGLGFGVGDAAGPFEDSPAEQHAPEHGRSAHRHRMGDSTEEQK